MIKFAAVLMRIGKWTIVQLPESASKQLPSRGQVMVTGTINGHTLRQILEPDGRWGHWFKINEVLQKDIGVSAGDTVKIEITPSKEWPEPDIPKDFAAALKIAPKKVKEKWKDVTPMARWEWIRWMNATQSQETRAARIEKTVSKLDGKHRRPCCFNVAACTDPDLSKNSRLIEPTGVENRYR